MFIPFALGSPAAQKVGDLEVGPQRREKKALGKIRSACKLGVFISEAQKDREVSRDKNRKNRNE